MTVKKDARKKSAANSKPSEDERAFDLLRKASEKGSADATYALGTWYLNGHHVKQNFKKGIGLIRKAAESNHPEALHDLAVGYETGTGIKKDESKALQIFMRAALYGDAQSHFEVGRMLYHGIGAPRNKDLAVAWLHRAKELGVVA